MNRTWLKGLASATLLLVLAGCAGSQTSSSTGPQGGSDAKGGGNVIKIGAAFNLTGAFSSLEGPASNGAKLALKEINAAGGINGAKLELELFDTKSDPATAANVVTQLVDQKKVKAVIGFCDSDYVLAGGPIAQKAGVPFIVVGATSPKLPDQIGDRVFMTPFGDNVQAAAGGEFAIKNLNAKTAWVIYDKAAEYTNLLAKYFKQRYTELGGQVVLEDTFQAGDKDFSAQITKLKALPTMPDVLYIASNPDEIGTIVKQVREAGVKQRILGGDGYDTDLLVKIAGPANTENVYFTTHGLMDPEKGTATAKAFIKAYKGEYQHDPENVFAALGYDSIKILANAIKTAGSSDPAKVTEALAKTKDLEAVTGKITYPAGKRVPQKGVSVILVKDGKFTLSTEMVPEKIPSP